LATVKQNREAEKNALLKGRQGSDGKGYFRPGNVEEKVTKHRGNGMQNQEKEKIGSKHQTAKIRRSREGGRHRRIRFKTNRHKHEKGKREIREKGNSPAAIEKKIRGNKAEKKNQPGKKGPRNRPVGTEAQQQNGLRKRGGSKERWERPHGYQIE